MEFPTTRMRRLRKNAKIRDIVRETKLEKEDLIYPIYFKEELNGDEKEVRVPSDNEEIIQRYLDRGYQIGRSPKTRRALSENYNYSSKGMLGKKQSDKQKAAASKACSYKRSDEQRKHFSDAKKGPNKFVCMRTPGNKSTIRVLVDNVDKYLAQGYKLCNS